MNIQSKFLRICDQQYLQDKALEVKLMCKKICTCLILIEIAKSTF